MTSFPIRNRRTSVAVFLGLALLLAGLGVLVAKAGMMPAAAVLGAGALFFGMQAMSYLKLAVFYNEESIRLTLPSVCCGILLPLFRTVEFPWTHIESLTLSSRMITVPIITTGTSQAMPYRKLSISGTGQRAEVTLPMMKHDLVLLMNFVSQRTGIIPREIS